MRRGAEENRERLARALAASDPLRAVWDMCSDAEGAALSAEFMALANHRKNIRAEIGRYAEQFRTMQVEVLSRVLEESGVDPKVWPLPAIVFLLESAARVLVIEQSLGMSTGHAEMIGLAKKYQELLADILHTADLAKFAKAQPLPQEHTDAMDKAKQLVRTSKPYTPVATEGNQQNEKTTE